MLAERITGENSTDSTLSITAGNHACRHGSGDVSRTSSTIDSGVASSNTVTSSPLPPPSPKSHRNCSTSRQKVTGNVLRPSFRASPGSPGPEVWKPGQKTTDFRSSHVIRGQQPTEQVKETAPLIKTPVWTPPGSPQTSKKQFRPVNFDKSLEPHSRLRKSAASSVSPPSPPASESYAWSSPDGAGIFSGAGFGGSSTLPKTQSATVTLLQQARRGQLPRGAKYLTADECDDIATQPVNYNIPRLRLPPPKEVDGVGPTTQEGMPVALRSTVKVENKGDWYRKVYDNLHKQPAGNSAVDGYYSEPDLSFDEDEIRYSRSSLKQLDRYRGQPGRIEDYLPGKSSIAQQHSEKFLQDNPHIRSANLQKLRNSASAAKQQTTPDRESFTQSVLDGNESDQALIYHRQITPQLTSSEQKQYYTQIQRGGEIPACGLRKPAPEKPKASDQRYQESNVNIHYRSPVRWEEKQPLSEEELGRRQEEAMKRIYQETRLRKQQQQTEDMLSRRHGDNFTPSQKSPIPLDRYDRLFGDETDSAGGGVPLFGTVLHDFQAQNNRELGVSKGDTVRIRRNVDSNWMEAQRGTRIGILPISYVQINDPRARPGGDRWTPKPQVRTRYHFKAQNNLELSLNKGDIVTVLKRVDDNWFEGRLGDRTGIFPISYVEPLDTDQPDARGVSTERQIKPQVSPVTHGIHQPNKQTPAVVSSSRQLNQLPRPTEKQLHVDVLQPHIPYRALYPYMRQNDDEMELREGDVIHVLEQCPDGWYVGTNQRSGMFGTFPGNYAQRL